MAFVLAMLGLLCCFSSLIALPLGLSAYNEAQRTGAPKGLSIAAMLLSGATLALWLFIFGPIFAEDQGTTP